MDMEDENSTESASNADPPGEFSPQIDTTMNTPSPTSISGTKQLTNRKNSNSPSVFQQKLLNVLDKSQNEDDDDDKHFLLSLLPGMKSIDNASKMDARIELMQVVQKYARKRLHHNISNTIPHIIDQP